MLNEHMGGVIGFGAIGVLGTIGAAAGGEWWPASKLSDLATLVPEQTFKLASGPASPGDLYFRQGAFSFSDSTAIGKNEGDNPVGLFPTLQFRGQFLDNDITFTTGFNARYLPTLREFRLQESFGLDYNLLRFNIGPYRASFGTEGRLNTYQQIDLGPETTTTFPAPEGLFMFRFRITEPPARPKQKAKDSP
jgi:hypothetical protein